MGKPTDPCPVCDYDLAGTSAEAPCPECGTKSPARTNQYAYERMDRARSLRVFAWMMVPSWVFLFTNLLGNGLAFRVLKLPRFPPIQYGTQPALDALYWVGMISMLLLPASAIGFLASPFFLIPAARNFQTGDNPQRLLKVGTLCGPAVVLGLVILLEPAPSSLFAWMPE